MTNYLKKNASQAKLFWVRETPFIEALKRTNEKTLKTSSIHPDFIFQSIADVQNLLIG
jgi:hypothetical protein